MDHDDLDEDIERLNIVLRDDDGEDEEESDGELRVLENNEEEYYSNASRPSTSSDITASSQPTTSVCTDADESLFRFDPNTITAETCLAMNRAYQEVLLDSLRQIEISLMENRHKQKELEESVDEKVKKTDKPTNKDTLMVETRHLPYFKDKDGKIPEFNADVKLKEQMNEDKQHIQPKLGWKRSQRRLLIDAIKLDALEQQIRPLLNKQEVEMEKLGKCKNTDEIEAAKARIEKLQEEIKQKQELPADQLLKSADTKKIDFMKISIFTFNNRFSESECESMWNNVLRPGINRDKWTAEEEEKLTKLATKYKMRNWKQIAEELATNRTPFQCLQHYQQNNIVYDNSEWTEEEDELLKEVVETCTYGMSRIHWHQVAYYIDRRSAQQCLSRWWKINPNRNLGRWTQEEDMQLSNAIQACGGIIDWTKVQELVPKRNASQCRGRYMKGISGLALFKPWTYEEDKKLITLQAQYNDKWTKISEHFESRNGNMLLLRHKCLMKWQRLMEEFYAQHRKVQKQLKHPAFRFGKLGLLIPKSGLRLRLGVKKGRPKRNPDSKAAAYKTELQLLKETGGKEAEEALEDIVEVKQEPVEEEEEEKEEEEESRVPNKAMQDKLDVFLARYNIQAEDYLKQLQDKLEGGIIVPRPPPIKVQKIDRVQNVWKKQNKLTDVVQMQIQVYLNKLQENLAEDDSKEMEDKEPNLYDQIAQHVKMEDEMEKRKLITAAFGGKNPSQLSVRELLNISRCIKESGRPPKNPKMYDIEPWEVDELDDDNDEEESSSEEEIEEISDEEEPKPKKPKTEKQIVRNEMLAIHMKKYHELEKKIKNIVQVKMDPSELTRGRGRRKQYLMYTKKILMKYRGLDEERRLNRKSLVLLMKTLDVDAKKSYFKAKRGKRRVSAMAFLKATEKANLRRAKTRLQKTEIQEAAQIEANVNSELSEVSDFLLELKDELKIGNDEEEDDGTLVDEDVVEKGPGQFSYTYNKSLPFIPPNQTNLRGMRSLLLEHRYLIDQAGYYFNPEKLKQQLYELKQKGPNPLMGVLNAVGKTESFNKKREIEKLEKSMLPPAVCQRQLEEVRKTRAYQQLKARFQSVFTWPALMATIRPPKGKPLPKKLQQVLMEPKPSTSKMVAANACQTSVNMEYVGDDMAGNVDTGEESGEVATENGDVSEEIEELSEPEAIEKLVDKIMEEYEKERMKKKRYLPTKKYRNFSEKQKQAFKEKEKTKILKKLGLYEKMQEYKRRHREAEESVNKSIASASGTDTVTGLTETGPRDAATRPGAENASSLAAETRDSVMITSEGCQTDMNPDDADTTEVLVKTETDVVPKRKRGRPQGSKTKCYSNKDPVRKSQRATDSPVVDKQEQDFELSPPKKKKRCNKDGTQYIMMRDLIPKKMSKIASQIPDLPILNEPIQEKAPKPARKERVRKPKPEKQKVGKSKFGVVGRGGGRRTGPKTNRILKQLKEVERLAAEAKVEASTATASKVQIKTEPCDLDNMENGDYDADNNIHYNVVVTEDVNPEIEENPKKIMTSRARKKIEAEKKILNSKSENSSVAAAGISNTGLNKKQGREMNGTPQKVTNGCEIGGIQSYSASGMEQAATGHSVETTGTDKIQSQNNQQQDQKPLLDGTEGKKPFLVAVPVMIGDIQQVAMIPFYPDEDGKITLPNGKKIDTHNSQGPGAVSLPVINFDQPVQVLNPSKQTEQNRTVSKPSPELSDQLVSNNEIQTAKSSSDASSSGAK